MVAACGPFSTTDNLLWEPLIELIASLESQPPDVLILIGPFVDAEHPVIKVRTIAVVLEQAYKCTCKVVVESPLMIFPCWSNHFLSLGCQ